MVADVLETNRLDELLSWRTADVSQVAGGVDGAMATRFESCVDGVAEELARLTGYSPDDARSLAVDQARYVRRLVDWTPRQPEQVVQSRDRPARVERLPFESSLVAVPSNAPVPIAGVLMASAVATGSRVIFTCARGHDRIVRRVIDLVGASSASVALWTGRTSDLVPAALEHRLIDHLYFMGSSEIYPSLARDAARAGCYVRFEGQGNGFVYVADSADIDSAAAAIVGSKAFCEGRMCSSPSGVIVQADIADEFLEAFGAAARQTNLVEPLGLSVRTDPWRAHLSLVEPEWEDTCHPLLVPLFPSSPAVLGESFAPCAWFSRVEDVGEARGMIASSPYRLQLSYFGRDESDLGELIRLRFARYCVNMNPADQDPLLPWGNFSSSGESPVEEFVDKFLSSRLFEGSLAHPFTAHQR